MNKFPSQREIILKGEAKKLMIVQRIKCMLDTLIVEKWRKRKIKFYFKKKVMGKFNKCLLLFYRALE